MVDRQMIPAKLIHCKLAFLEPSGRAMTKPIKATDKMGHYIKWSMGLYSLKSCNYFYSVQHKTKPQNFLLSLLTLEKKKITCTYFWNYAHWHRSVLTEMGVKSVIKQVSSIPNYFLGHNVAEPFSFVQLGWKEPLGYVYFSKLNILVN